jgi:biotin carboxyl carrier protein
MIVKVKIEEQVFNVEINDLQQRPIIAVVDGDEFEIWPEGEPAMPKNGARDDELLPQSTTLTPAIPVAPAAGTTQSHPTAKELAPFSPSVSDTFLTVRAPIPGVITSVDVHAGSEVSVGQQLCVLEAMKMNNSIRASRAGRISVVHITTGQHVKHHDILLEYAGE